MKKKLPFHKAVPPTSERFHLAVEYALDHLKEEENVKRTTKMSLGMALALILALALMATAFALTNGFGILEFFFGKENTTAPLESANALVQTDLGAVEKYGCSVSVTEAVYTGPNLLLMVDVTLPAGSPYTRSMGFSLGPEGLTSDGSTELAYDLMSMVFVEGPTIPQGVTYRACIEVLIQEEPPSVIEMEISVPVDIPENTMSEPREWGDEAFQDELELVVRIPQTKEGHWAAFTPDTAAAENAGLEILSVQAQYTDLEAVVTIDYAISGDTAQGPFYGTAAGVFFHTDPICSGMKNAILLDDLEGKRPCPVCVTNDSGASREEEVYRADGSPYNHLDPECELLAGLAPQLLTGASAPILEPRCPVCGGLERRVIFFPLDEQGEEIAVKPSFHDIGRAAAVDADGRVLRRQILRMQTSEEIPAVLLLRVVESNNDGLADLLEGASGEVLYAPIRCERQE